MGLCNYVQPHFQLAVLHYSFFVLEKFSFNNLGRPAGAADVEARATDWPGSSYCGRTLIRFDYTAEVLPSTD